MTDKRPTIYLPDAERMTPGGHGNHPVPCPTVILLDDEFMRRYREVLLAERDARAKRARAAK